MIIIYLTIIQNVFKIVMKMLELGHKHLQMGLNNARNVRMELRISYFLKSNFKAILSKVKCRMFGITRCLLVWHALPFLLSACLDY